MDSGGGGNMYPQQVHDYLQTFFKETNCPIISDSNHYLTVQLTIDMDKKIMNRPFYWKYLESTDGVPNPAQLTFITDQNNLEEDIKGEIVHFGSPRLNQLFQATKELGAFVQIFERVNQFEAKKMLTPWLGVNYKVSYYSDQTKEMLHSLGINLMTGQRIDGFHESLSKVDLVSAMSENAFPMQYSINPTRGLERLDEVIETIIQQDNHTWAEQAKKRWARDLKVLDYFYEGLENKPDWYEIEKTALEERYKPRIKIEIVNGGLFYLK